MNHPKNHAEPVVFDNRDIARYAPGERHMAMRGFEAEYTDIVDYIVRITHRIWEEKEVGYIYDAQHRVANGIFTQELTLPDEMSMRRQIAAQRLLT